MNNLSRIIVIVVLITSCSSGKRTIDKPRSWGDYIYIEGKKVLIDDKHRDSIQYRTDSSYMKNKQIERKHIEKENSQIALKEPTNTKSNFSLSITTYNHAEQIFDGKTTYSLIKDTLTIHKIFVFSDQDSILFSKKLDTNSIEKLEKIRLDSLEDFYFNHCIMGTSGNEYFISTTIDTVNKKISLHNYYNEQIEKLINELNKNIPKSFKLDYLPKDTKQDCE